MQLFHPDENRDPVLRGRIKGHDKPSRKRSKLTSIIKLTCLERIAVNLGDSIGVQGKFAGVGFEYQVGDKLRIFQFAA
jgi:hypothetical protein